MTSEIITYSREHDLKKARQRQYAREYYHRNKAARRKYSREYYAMRKRIKQLDTPAPRNPSLKLRLSVLRRALQYLFTGSYLTPSEETSLG